MNEKEGMRRGPPRLHALPGVVVSLALAACGSSGDGTAADLGAGNSPGGSGHEPVDDSGASDASPRDRLRRCRESGRERVGPRRAPPDDATGGVDAGRPDDGGGDAGADECAGGITGESSDSSGSKTSASGYGSVEFSVSTQTQIVGLRTTLTVPAKPPASGTLFLWPGLQPLPGGKNYNPIGNGVLQPVLTWGGTCAPTAPSTYASWWISSQYVNTYGSYMGHTGCLGGQGMNVSVGDVLDIDMTLGGTVWNQEVSDRQTGDTATFSIDMLGQAQDWGLFEIESDGSKPVTDVIFTSTVLTMAAADAAACQPSARGTNDYFSAPALRPTASTAASRRSSCEPLAWQPRARMPRRRSVETSARSLRALEVGGRRTSHGA